MMKKTLEWECPTASDNVVTNWSCAHQLVRGDIFTVDHGDSWHVFRRFGKSVIPNHVVIVTLEGSTIAVKPFDKVIIKKDF